MSSNIGSKIDLVHSVNRNLDGISRLYLLHSWIHPFVLSVEGLILIGADCFCYLSELL